MINWENIDIVLLDMDGTLLDLYFDNYFWREFVPHNYAQRHGMEIAQARQHVFDKYQAVEGTINWYCVDYWTEQLDLDIAQLKAEVDHLITIHPNVIRFLEFLRQTGKRSVLVTNAHQKSLMLKMDRTALHNHLDDIVCAHDFGLPKEYLDFWDKLKEKIPFDKTRTLLIDDSLPVLKSARQYGISHLLSIYKPDSQNPVKDVEDFQAIHDFADIMPESNTG